jgi:hypothetical protein
MTTATEDPDWANDGWALDMSCHRHDPTAVGRALTRLAVEPGPGFVAFHERYAGVFGSRNTGYELLDLCHGEPDYPFDPSYPSIVAATEVVRELYEIPHRYLVISTYLGDAVLMYDTTTDLVYSVDFQGGDEELRRGELEPSYPSFRALLADFFGLGTHG